MDDMRSANIDFLTIGQYLQPTIKQAHSGRCITVPVLPVPLPRLDLRRADDRLPPPAQLAVGLVVVVAERAGHAEDLPVCDFSLIY